MVHHSERLKNVVEIIKNQPGINEYDTAKQMHWDIRTKDWSTFPTGQKCFAVGEALTHLAYLTEKQIINKNYVDGCFRYYVA